MNRLEKQVAIVTGGSKGIGRAIVAALAREGAKVTFCARNGADVKKAVEEFSSGGFAVDGRVADVSSEADIRSLVEAVAKRDGRVDILVNNAGLGVFGNFADSSIADIDTMLNTNIRGVMLATHEVLPLMIRQNGGQIVHIASLAGKNTVKGGAVYSATKWALRGFAASLMLEVREHNIRMVTVCPGSVETAFSVSGKRGKNITQPEDVADAVVFAITAPARSMFSEIDVRPTRP